MAAIQLILRDDGYSAAVCLFTSHPFAKIARRWPDGDVVDFPYQESLAWTLLDQLETDPRTSSVPVIGDSTGGENLSKLAARVQNRCIKASMFEPFEPELLLDVMG